MNALEEFINNLVEYISSLEEFAEYKIIRAFPSEIKQSPLKTVTLACSADKIRFEKAFMGDSVQGGHGITAEIEVLISIHVPSKNGGRECGAISGLLAQKLLFSSSFGIYAITCGKISHRRETSSFIVPVTVLTRVVLKEGD